MAKTRLVLRERPKCKSVLVSLWMPLKMWERLGEIVERGWCANRSELVRQAVAHYLMELRELEPEERLAG